MSPAATPLGFLHEEAGSSLVEFALSATVFTMTLFGVLGAAFALYVDHYVDAAARDGARYAMVRGSTWTGTSCASTQTLQCAATAANITSYIKAVTPAGFPLSNLKVNTTWPGSTPSGSSCDTTQGADSPGCTVAVQVSYSVHLLVPFVSKPDLTLSSTAKVAVAQ